MCCFLADEIIRTEHNVRTATIFKCWLRIFLDIVVYYIEMVCKSWELIKISTIHAEQVRQVVAIIYIIKQHSEFNYHDVVSVSKDKICWTWLFGCESCFLYWRQNKIEPQWRLSFKTLNAIIINLLHYDN